MFSLGESEERVPAKINFQVWDADCFSSDDILGSMSFDLTKIPKGTKTSKSCVLKTFDSPNYPTMNIFKQKRIKGWWPVTAKDKNGKKELTGKIEAEFILMRDEDATKHPAGHGRSEPDSLPAPK